MKTRSLALASLASITAALSLPASAQQMVAGWDFSQYAAPTFLSLDGVTFANTLDANYSDFDPTFNAGAESAAFGTMWMNGSAGSTSVDPSPGANPPFTPFSESLVSNLDAPVVQPFDSHTVLLDEGQFLASFLSMFARAPVDVVFEADLTSVPQTGSHWSVSFGGKTVSGTSMVSIEFSTDGSSYTGFGSVQLTDADTVFSVDLGETTSETGFVRFGFAPVGESHPIIDNVAIHVPEPGGNVLAIAAGLAMLAAVRLRRVAALPRH